MSQSNTGHNAVEPAAAGKVVAPLARELAEATAVQVGACIRPIAVRRIDEHTGQRQVIPIPCGSTRASKCPPCADRARRLRIWQAREGWHLDHEPEVRTAEPTARQRALLGQLADLTDAHADADADGDEQAVRALNEAIGQAEAHLRAEGTRGSLPHPGRPGKRRVRSTRRRQDTPNLPRRPVTARTTGRVFDAPDGRTYRPSTFVTLTLPSYGPARGDGAPRDLERYDYRRAARDAIHFGELVDRFWQNLRRATGWNVQYFAAVEPQRRGAPHLHAAIRGTIPRRLIREVAAATYHQVWWPPHDNPRYTVDNPPTWDPGAGGYVDPDTGHALPTWNQALDALDADPGARPAHVVRLGAQLDVQGVLAGTEQAGQCLRYLVKYLTKSVGECHHAETDATARHVDRLVEALRVEPCSPRCANWLLYGVQPHHARPDLAPGACGGAAHRPGSLGYPGRRCLVSRRWSGKNLTEHRADRHQHVLRTLGAVGMKPDQHTGPAPGRYRWEPISRNDPTQPHRLELLLRAIAERRRWRQQYEHARSATDDHAA